MNEAKWDSLPAGIQALFREVSNADWHAEVGKVWAAADAHGIEVAVNSGNTHIQLTEEEWGAFDARTASVVDRWIANMDAKGLDGRALYDRAVELVNQNMASN
jgi:TRAP-type C4-dicarboxylate transport system substrate-binding protein